MVVSAAAIILNLARTNAGRDSLPLETLTRQAAPAKVNYALFLAIACLLAAFILNYVDDPKGMRSMLVLAAVAVGIFAQVLQLWMRRVSALEGIIKRSLPEVYSQIAGGKG